MTAPNEPVRAFMAWVEGKEHDPDLAREGAAEVIDECTRLRAMILSLTKAFGVEGLGADYFGWNENKSRETGTRAMEDGDG